VPIIQLPGEDPNEAVRRFGIRFVGGWSNLLMKLVDKSKLRSVGGYRPDIDGLRALAVLVVVAFHGFPEYLPGGFVGVDVFFVISGFLISGIILDETHLGTFSLQRFYARRVRRIFPALLLVLVTSLLVGCWLLPNDLVRLGRQVAASAVFVSNFYLWFQSGYFSPDARTFPLLHLWSLGVEEQFYIVWPLVIMGLRSRLSWSIFAIALIGVSSFCLNIAFIQNHEADFYSPLTRAWELMLGASLAWFQRRDDAASPATWSADIATIAGLILISCSALLFSQESSYPGWLALVPTIGASLTLWGGATSRIASSILSARTLVFIGLISYPVYLWHWPLLVFSEAFKFAPLTPLERILVIVFSFILAWLTYKLVESKFRAGRAKTTKKVATLVTGMIFVAVAGLVVVEGQGFEDRFPKEIREFAEVRGYPSSWRVHECLIDPKTETTFGMGCMEEARPLLLVWGDSTATALMPGLRQLQQERNFGLAQFTANSCGPWLSVDVPGYSNCRSLNDEVLGVVTRMRPDIVVLHGRGSTRPEDIAGLRKTIFALRALPIPHIIVLGPVPVWKRSLPNEVLRYFMLHRALIPVRSSQRVYNLWNDTQMRSTITDLGAEYISAWDLMCDTDGCLTRLSEKPEDITASDAHHLTESGSKFLIESIKDKIVPVGALTPRP
jgi:peptidoglycan/LPS O-acetylase OafA/YrhL